MKWEIKDETVRDHLREIDNIWDELYHHVKGLTKKDTINETHKV